MGWPKGTPRPEWEATPARLRQLLLQSAKTVASKNCSIGCLKVEIRNLKKERRQIKEKLKSMEYVDAFRFKRGSEKYYLGILSYLPIQNFLKEKNLNPKVFQIIMLCIYHEYIIIEDMLKWFIIADYDFLNKMVANGYLYKQKAGSARGNGMRNIFTPTELSKTIIAEYQVIIGKYLNVQLKVKKEIDNEKAKLGQPKRRTAKVC